MPQKIVTIGRSTGPSTDVEVEVGMSPEEIAIAKDTIAVVNRVSGGNENWYIVIDGQLIIPETPKVQGTPP